MFRRPGRYAKVDMRRGLFTAPYHFSPRWSRGASDAPNVGAPSMSKLRLTASIVLIILDQSHRLGESVKGEKRCLEVVDADEDAKVRGGSSRSQPHDQLSGQRFRRLWDPPPQLRLLGHSAQPRTLLHRSVM
jgi:hypothetical protein